MMAGRDIRAWCRRPLVSAVWLVWVLVFASSCTRFGFGAAPREGGVADQGQGEGRGDLFSARDSDDALRGDGLDAATPDDGLDDGGVDVSPDQGIPGALVVAPAQIADRWVEEGRTKTYVVAVSTTGTCVPATLQVSGMPAEVSVKVAGLMAPKTLRVELSVAATAQTPRSVSATLTVTAPPSACRPAPATLDLVFRVVKLKAIHVGPRANSCPHGSAGGVVVSCDYTGQGGLRQAVAAAPSGKVHIFLHDAGPGSLTTYDTNVDLLGQTWISTAPSSDPTRIALRRGSSVYGDVGLFRLVEDDIHLSRLSLICDSDVNWCVTTWTSPKASATTATGHHLIEDLWFRAIAPERMGYNGIRGPFLPGSDTTLRNCRIEGFFESDFRFAGARRTRFIQNTFVSYQHFKQSIDVRDTQDVIIANNVFISESLPLDSLVVGNNATQGFVFVGNVVEGAKALVSGLPAGGNQVIQDNHLGGAELESPFHPRFLANATQGASARVPSEGLSLDSVPLVGGASWVPGAIQGRSALSARRTVIRVGDGSFGSQACDIDASAKNEIQQALWSVWRGGTVEVYPSSGKAYAGPAIIGWPLTLKGMGSQPQEVVITNRDELLVPSSWDLWRHEAVVTVLEGVDAEVTIETLSIDADTGASMALHHAVILEAYDDPGRTDESILRRVRLRALGGSRLDEAILAGDRSRIQDVLIAGSFGACVTWGPREGLMSGYPTERAKVQVINLSCRLTGSSAPRAAFELASAYQSLLVNVAVELSRPAPLFRAQRRSHDDTGIKAKDLPVSFAAHALSMRGVSTNYDGFDTSDGAYHLVAVESVGSTAPFFVSAQDSHLATGSAAIDRGVDPSSLVSSLKAGVSLDGVLRQGRQIDRGAYEQGK